MAPSLVTGRSAFLFSKIPFLSLMAGHKPPYIFYLCWKYLGPAVMMGVFMFYLVSYSPVTYGQYKYPSWAEAIGLCLSLASMIWVPIYAVYYLGWKQVGAPIKVGDGLRSVQQ